MVKLFGEVYNGKSVLITGNTGFKGSWLARWLTFLGASVTGYSKSTTTEPNHYNLLKNSYEQIWGDVNDLESLKKNFSKNFDLVFHMAAQSLVRPSYAEPIETLQTNILGTANVLEATRKHKSIKGMIVVTSDKCYENNEDSRSFIESDPMGGHDPYSASKGCAELIVNSYRKSFFPENDYKTTHNQILVSARAGNVIGGGDWSEDRLIPDAVKSAVVNKPIQVRFPQSIRPWQHVMEPLLGYLLLGEKILKGDIGVSGAWNFGPLNNETKTVTDVLDMSHKIWPNIKMEIPQNSSHLHEAKLLHLDCSKAQKNLNWIPIWDTSMAIKKTINWYKNYYESRTINTDLDIQDYVKKAMELNCLWVSP
jgi:CDP-glucose 4,6-dehydratase